jgi:hypothetical protein
VDCSAFDITYGYCENKIPYIYYPSNRQNILMVFLKKFFHIPNNILDILSDAGVLPTLCDAAYHIRYAVYCNQINKENEQYIQC